MGKKKDADLQAASVPTVPLPVPAAQVITLQEAKAPGKIDQIIDLHKAGKTNAEIVEAGFNKTTVSIQVSKYKKANGSADEPAASSEVPV